MFQLSHLKGKEVTPEDWLNLAKAMAVDYTGYTIYDLGRELDQLQAQIWRITGPDTNILLVTEILIHPAGNELHLRYLAGIGWFKHFEPVFDHIKDLARKFNCRFITGKLRGKHAERWYQAWGVKPSGVWCIRDLKDEQQQKDNDDAMDRSLQARGSWDTSGNTTCH